MKTTSKLIIFAITPLFMAANAHALTPREELSQMVQQLQKNPSDNTLREKIIKLAQRIKPAPAIPEDALRREGRAKFAFKSAKSNDDYLGAAREYEEAVRVAPWVSGYYSDLCTIYEKAEKYIEAKRNCEFYLTGLSDPSQVNEVKQRIAGLEFGIEKSAPAARAQRERQELRDLVKTLDGKVFIGEWKVYRNGARSRMKVKIRGEEMAIGSEFIREDGTYSDPGTTFGERFSYASDRGTAVIQIDSFEPAWKTQVSCWDGVRHIESVRKATIDKTGRMVTLAWCDEVHILR